MKKTLGALALILAAVPSWGAVCSSTVTSLGTVSETTTPNPYEFSGLCSAIGLDPAAAGTWTFTHEVRFSLDRAADIFGGIDLNLVRSVPPMPGTPGQPWFTVSIDPILLVHEGTQTIVGGELPGPNEASFYRAHDLAAGDYTLLLRGTLYDIGARTGFFEGNFNVRFNGIAAPVPEPATQAMLLLAGPLVALGLRGRRR